LYGSSKAHFGASVFILNELWHAYMTNIVLFSTMFAV
jgi:hypothetical protein